MSQRRQKKQLSIIDNVNSLSDQELRAALKKYDVTAGPITDSTRNLYRKKLASVIEENEAELTPNLRQDTPSKGSAQGKTITAAQSVAITEEDEDEDTSDEDFNVRDEDLEEEDEDEEFDDEESEDLMSELQDDDITLSSSNTTGLADLTTRAEPPANRISRGIVISIISFFVALLSFYILSINNTRLMEQLRPLKKIAIPVFLLAASSPIGYILYKIFQLYQTRRREDEQRVCKLVEEALEILLGHDTPSGLVPILHIRDVLLTAAERKSKKVLKLWSKAVKFIEEHESRVKVEMVNIDGEDFRAWKWIGKQYKLQSV